MRHRLMAVMSFNFLWSIILSGCVNAKAAVVDDSSVGSDEIEGGDYR